MYCLVNVSTQCISCIGFVEHRHRLGSSVVSFSFSFVVVLRKLIIYGFQEFEETSQAMV